MLKDYGRRARAYAFILILSFCLLCLYLISGYPDVIEKTYAQKAFPVIALSQHLLFNVIAVPIGEVFYTALVFYFLFSLAKFIISLVKKRFYLSKSMLLKGFALFEVMLLCFYLCWGLNYFRQPAAQLLNLRDESYTLNDAKQISSILIDSLNRCRSRLQKSDYQTSNSAIFAEALSAENDLRIYNSALTTRQPQVKSSLFSAALNYMGTSGYYNPFTGEAQVNDEMPVFDRPVTACHEMAHQMGFAREDEANFIGFLAGSRSANHMLRYSAYYLAVEEFLHYLKRRDSTAQQQLKRSLSAEVKSDFKTDSLYWSHYEGRAEAITGLFYNRFLKINNQPAGLRTYNRMIILMMAYYRRKQNF